MISWGCPMDVLRMKKRPQDVLKTYFEHPLDICAVRVVILKLLLLFQTVQIFEERPEDILCPEDTSGASLQLDSVTRYWN
ncbi:hypothetical protein EAI_14392 [Harpegnathos saltator]|uniref:Uncharacterized protein n=1 Tax=Harpegnathos saltator TaxID=610380 RepID=E2BAL2_HARSA|nr:hypothetical protein EAI_14392 [Harpegnathos saltator]